MKDNKFIPKLIDSNCNLTNHSPIPDLPEISVVMPALDEETTIGKCITEIQEMFRAQHFSGEIIVSDSSTDMTADIASGLGAKVVHPSKKGYGNAYFEGFRHAKSEYIVMLDSDGTYDPSDIPPMIIKLREGADLVIGSRFNGKIFSGSMSPLHRYIGNPLLTWILNVVFGTHFSDAHSGFRAIRRDALESLHLLTGGMEFASEMLVMASKKGLKIEEVPISYFPRKTPSKLHSFADGWRHLRFVLLMNPIPFLELPGVIFSIFGFTLMCMFYLKGDIESSHLNSFILGAILLIGGIQVFITGINLKVYCIVHGYEEKTESIESFLNYHSLERFLLAGGTLILCGVLIGLLVIADWVKSHFGEISQISNSVISLSLIIIGMQVLSGSIMISMMLLNDGELP